MITPPVDHKRLAWYQTFAPSTVTFYRIRTGEQVQEPSLVAVELGGARCLAVGGAALAYQGTPGMAVYSPLWHGQIADYTAAQFLLRALFRRVGVKTPLFKPVLYVREQEHTTEVEERALIDGAIQMGARRVLLYQDSLSAMLNRVRADAKLRNAVILHIEPQEERGISYVPAHPEN